ncbi:TOX high mobility group box family member 2 isoform X11 [Phodopus roborovskii]|uniref:TOX high mobility group box family member 2 isoform X11 n=1 Tax=Phodopus roborovskii TaxID=109678 RepID=UPI0021E4666C|nr:TOX high mobility group box family member 2 isoform X11 [Phodopus roborovskii]
MEGVRICTLTGAANLLSEGTSSAAIPPTMPLKPGVTESKVAFSSAPGALSWCFKHVGPNWDRRWIWIKEQHLAEAVADAFSPCLGFCGMRLRLLLSRHWCIAGASLQKFDGDSAYVGMSDGNPELLPTSQIQEMVHSEVAAYDSGRPGPLLGRPAMLASHMSALSQSQLISQMGIRSGIAHSSPSPPGSKSATPSPSSSTQEEESDAHFKISGEKRPSADPGKKTKNPKKKKKKDPNEPQKPVSAYALFFRDTQAAIKGQNPSATFGDVSKIVASMWDSLGEEQKQAYKRKTEAAKKEYLKALAAYRASLVSKSPPDQGEAKNAQANPPAKMLPPKQPMYAMPGLASFLTPSDLQAFRTGASPASLARTLGSKALLPGLSTSPPPPSFPLSPSLHQQLPLPPHAQGTLLSPPLSMSPAPQPPVLPASMALQVQLAMSPSPPGPQDFPHISEFPSGSGSRSPGPSNPSSSGGDWDGSYPSGERGLGTCRLCRGSPPPTTSPKNLQEPSAR